MAYSLHLLYSGTQVQTLNRAEIKESRVDIQRSTGEIRPSRATFRGGQAEHSRSELANIPPGNVFRQQVVYLDTDTVPGPCYHSCPQPCDPSIPDPCDPSIPDPCDPSIPHPCDPSIPDFVIPPYLILGSLHPSPM